MGIKESEFWEMTIAELTRAIESRNRVEKARQQEKATFDYILGDLIGRSVARIYSSSATYTDIAEVYPTLFDAKELQEKRAEKQAELSALRFKLFADAHNAKIKEVAKVNNE